jgi:hypothetical protein
MFSIQACRTAIKQHFSAQARFGRQLAKANPDILNAARVLSPSVPVYKYPSPYFHGLFQESLLADTFSSMESRLLSH